MMKGEDIKNDTINTNSDESGKKLINKIEYISVSFSDAYLIKITAFLHYQRVMIVSMDVKNPPNPP